MILAALILIAIVAILQAIDALKTVRGIAAGFEEGNQIIRAFFGPKPKEWQIFLVNYVTLSLFAAPALFSENVGVYGLGMGLLTGLAARHIQGIYEWHKAGF
jgi:4-hydroxybenzoate polyprenyltransferase